MAEESLKAFKRFYVFVHPVFAYFAETEKGGAAGKGRQEYKALLGRKVKEIAKDKAAALIWVSPWNTIQASFHEWVNRQFVKGKRVSWNAFDAYLKPYQRLRDFAQKEMGQRFFSVAEDLYSGNSGIKGVMRLHGAKAAEDAEFLVFGERRQLCVSRAVGDLKILFGRKHRQRVLEGLSVPGGEWHFGSYQESYRKFRREQMKGRRAAARKKRRERKKAAPKKPVKRKRPK